MIYRVVEYKAAEAGAATLWAIETKAGSGEYRLLSLYETKEAAHAVLDRLNVIEAEANVQSRRG